MYADGVPVPNNTLDIPAGLGVIQIPFSLSNTSDTSPAFPLTTGTPVGGKTYYPLTPNPRPPFSYATTPAPSTTAFTLTDNDTGAATYAFQARVIANGTVYTTSDPSIINKGG